MIAWSHIHNLTSPDGLAGRGNAQNKTITTGHNSRLTQAQLRPRTLSRLEFLNVEQAYAGRNLLRSTVYLNMHVVYQGAFGICQQGNACIEQQSAAQLSGQGNHISSLDLGARYIRQIDRDTAPWLCHLDLVSMRLQAANTCPNALRQYLNFLPYLENTIKQCTCDNCPEARHAEDAINRQARAANVLALMRFIEDSI
jgi:hypothetical protein